MNMECLEKKNEEKKTLEKRNVSCYCSAVGLYSGWVRLPDWNHVGDICHFSPTQVKVTLNPALWVLNKMTEHSMNTTWKWFQEMAWLHIICKGTRVLWPACTSCAECVAQRTHIRRDTGCEKCPSTEESPMCFIVFQTVGLFTHSVICL